MIDKKTNINADNTQMNYCLLLTINVNSIP